MLVVVVSDEERSLRARFLPSFPTATESHEQALWSSRVRNNIDVKKIGFSFRILVLISSQ